MSQQSDIKKKNKALKLLAEGVSRDDIVAKFKITKRTLYRWLKEAEALNLRVDMSRPPTAEDETGKDSRSEKTQFVSPMTELNKIANARPDEIVDVTLNRQMAQRLLRLTDKALALTEEILDDEGARCSDRLKAAQLVASWVGLATVTSYSARTVPERIVEQFGLAAPQEERPPLTFSDKPQNLQEQPKSPWERFPTLDSLIR